MIEGACLLLAFASLALAFWTAIENRKRHDENLSLRSSLDGHALALSARLKEIKHEASTDRKAVSDLARLCSQNDAELGNLCAAAHEQLSELQASREYLTDSNEKNINDIFNLRADYVALTTAVNRIKNDLTAIHADGETLMSRVGHLESPPKKTLKKTKK